MRSIRHFNPPVLLYINSFNFHSVPQKCNNKCITQRYYLSNLIPIQYHRNIIVNVLPKGITCTSVSYIFEQTLSVCISTTKQKKLQKRTEKGKDMIGNNFYVVQHYIDSLGSFRIYSFSTY